MNEWFYLDLGDGVTAFGPTQAIMEAYKKAFIESGMAKDMAIFSRHDLSKNVVTAYFTPAADTLARSLGARSCPKPVRNQDLCLLVGPADSFSLHFPEEKTIRHRNHKIVMCSYKLADGQWMPEAHVQRTSGDQERVTPIRGESGTSFETEAEANAEAKRLATAWIDAH